MKENLAIQVESLTKSFDKFSVHKSTLREEIMQFWGLGKKRKVEKFTALDEVSFEVKKGEVLGIVGPNGAGKSTLLKILSKITIPDSGFAKLNGRISSLLEVGTGFHRELSGRENIYLNGLILGMKKTEVKELEDQIIDFSGVAEYIDTPIKHYSSGMAVRLAFSVAAHLSADILLIDEVLAVGDAAFQAKCLDKMQNISDDGRTVIFVSHQLNVVQQLCNRCLLIKDGKLRANGSTQEVVNKYLEELSLNNEVIYPDQPIRKITAFQQEDKIIVKADYVVDLTVKIPAFGFVIYDVFGQPLSGSNPMMTDDHLVQDEYPKKGHIHIEIKQPKLLDGTYFLSFWFGVNGYRAIHKVDKCLSFQITGMVPQKHKALAKNIGSAHCECKFTFS